MKKMILAFLALLLGSATVFADAINMTDTRPCGIPKGWEAFGKGGSCRYENGLLRITDQESKFEWGIRKIIPISQPGRYTFTMEVALPAQTTDSGHLKLVLMAGNKTGTIGYLNRAKNGDFTKISSTIELPEKTSKLTVYISSSFNETGDYYIRKATFTRSEKR
jgi:hypothetical protein